VGKAHKEVLGLLAAHRSQLDALATALLEHETLDEDDAYAAAGVPHQPDMRGRPDSDPEPDALPAPQTAADPA
jgi:cell division protease FtsH